MSPTTTDASNNSFCRMDYAEPKLRTDKKRKTKDGQHPYSAKHIRQREQLLAKKSTVTPPPPSPAKKAKK